MGREERVSLFGLLALAIIYTAASLAIPLGVPTKPGPGVFPLAVGTFTVGVSLAAVIRAWPQAVKTGGTVFPAAADGRRVLALFAALCLYIALFVTVGFLVAAFLVVGAILWLMGLSSKPLVLVAALLATAISYYVFSVLLNVPLPVGMWS